MVYPPSRMLRLIKGAGVAWVGATVLAIVLFRTPREGGAMSQPSAAPVVTGTASTVLSPGAKWYGGNRDGCTAGEIDRRLANVPPPKGPEGKAFVAVCFAIAGKTEKAREVLAAIPAGDRGVVKRALADAAQLERQAGGDVAAVRALEEGR
jgi:hypothetical protein